MSVRRVDPPQQPPGFFLCFWLFFVKLAHSFTGLFKSKAPSTTLPTPVTAGSQTARHKPPPVPRRLELVDTKLSNRRSPQRSSQKKGFSSQSPAVHMAAEIHQDTLYRDGTDTQNEDLRTKKRATAYFPGFIGRTVSPGRIPEGGALRTATSLRTSAQPLDRDLRRFNSITPVVAEIWNPALVPNSPFPSRGVSLRIASTTNGSILSLSPVNPRLAAMPRSTGPRLRISSSAKSTQVSASESIHSISASPFAIRRGFSGASVKIPHSSIRLQSPWSPSDKTLPHDVWMNSEGVLANVQGPVYVSLDATKSSQDDVVLQHGPYTQLPCAPSSRFSDDVDDFISIYSNIFDFPEEEKYEEEGSSKGTSQGDSFTVNGTDKDSPTRGAAAGLLTTIPVDDSAAIKLDTTQNSAEDVKFEDLNKSNMSSELEEGFFCVVSQSKFDLTSDDHTSGLAYIPSLKNREVRPLSIAVEPVDQPDRTTKRFSVPCLHSVREFDQSPLRTSTSDSSPSKHFPAAESRSLRALADLISLLDFAAMEAVEADDRVGEPRLIILPFNFEMLWERLGQMFSFQTSLRLRSSLNSPKWSQSESHLLPGASLHAVLTRYREPRLRVPDCSSKKAFHRMMIDLYHRMVHWQSQHALSTSVSCAGVPFSTEQDVASRMIDDVAPCSLSLDSKLV